MNFKMIGRFLGQIIAVEGAFMIPALVISLAYDEMGAVRAFLYTLVILLAVSVILYSICRKAGSVFGAREGLVCVGFSWIVMSLLGCLPFRISGEIPSYLDALFEIVSGFTTTGSTILSDVESLSKGLLYWRSFSHWLGGMGVLVFLLAIAPNDSRGNGFSMHLLRAESPGPNVGKLVPKMRQTALILYAIYIVLTLLNILFLCLGKMPLFDAVCTAFGTAGTGGFGVKNDSIAGYGPYIQTVCTVFMLLFGVNFSCYYLLLLRKMRDLFRDEELRLYLGFFAVSTILIAWNIFGIYGNVRDSMHHAAFQVSSIMTTTGFASTDFDLWPSFSKGILMMLMVTGACAGSTGGGIKVARVLLLIKTLRRNVRQILNPHKVQIVRSNGQSVRENVLENTNAYLAAYVLIVIISYLLVSLDNFSIGTNLTAVLACFNNIGPGMELVGPSCNFGGFSALSKIVLILDMLAGRLEIYPIMVLLSRSTWRRR